MQRGSVILCRLHRRRGCFRSNFQDWFEAILPLISHNIVDPESDQKRKPKRILRSILQADYLFHDATFKRRHEFDVREVHINLILFLAFVSIN